MFSIRCSLFAVLLLPGSLAVLTDAAAAQKVASADTAAITGVVADPQGAVVPGAAITITRAGSEPITLAADERGHFSIDSLKPGLYTVEATYPGFHAMRKEALAVNAGDTQRLTMTLAIEADQQQVTVSDDDIPDSSPEKNGGAIVLKGKALDTLSDDSTELQQQLEAIAGSDPEAGSNFYVDGFSGGKLPPKSSIREIRINQNPYSAEFDELGWGRIEIFTKPGTDKLHGEFWTMGNDSEFNSRNPFVTQQPDYYTWYYEGNLNGPLTKKSSYFADIYGMRGQTDSIVNAYVLGANNSQVNFTQAVSSPTNMVNFTPRFDFTWGKAQTISLRYGLQRNTQSNAGIGQLALASQAYTTDNTEQTLQFSDTQTYGKKLVNETRFQYIRDRNNQTPINKTQTINVSGAFISGGSNAGIARDNQDHYEFQDYLTVDAGAHDLHFGVRIRDVRDSNYSTAGFNGQYTFTSLSNYAAGTASQYTLTQGKPGIVVSLLDTGIFAEDNWKVNANTTLSYGARVESQTDIPDHGDFAPRVGLAYSIPGGKDKKGQPKPPRAIIRTGSGVFYQRFPSTNVLQARRENGITQSTIVVNSPVYNPNGCATSADPATCAGGTASATTPTIYTIDPHLRSPYDFIAGIGVDKQFGPHVSLSGNYLYSHGQHLFLTRNINAPLPGTYNPADPTSGTRPLGINENIDQYSSDGTSERNRVTINGNVQSKLGGIFAYYMWSRMNTNAGGATPAAAPFPSNSYDLHQDFGRGPEDLRGRIFAGGYTRLPYGFRGNAFFIYQSKMPFNITTGQDNNGDTQFNDRPSFATDLSRPSVVQTAYGNFDTNPIAGQTIIPINYGVGHSLYVLNMRLNREFQFGPEVKPDGPPPPPPAKDAKPKLDKHGKPIVVPIEHKYKFGIGIAGNNVLNHVNLGPPVGVLSSPLFGQSNTLNSLWGGDTANRVIRFQSYFNF